jgi:Fe-S-cluster-containing dehydrogenase component
MSSGRIPICIEYSATRAARFADLTDANVASASTSVPPAVASEATVDHSTIP